MEQATSWDGQRSSTQESLPLIFPTSPSAWYPNGSLPITSQNQNQNLDCHTTVDYTIDDQPQWRLYSSLIHHVIRLHYGRYYYECNLTSYGHQR